MFHRTYLKEVTLTRSNEKRKVLLISTGGTIEKSYDENDGSLKNRESIIKPTILDRLRLPYTDISIKTLMTKDSLFMDDTDRRFIAGKIDRFQAMGIPMIIIHGTDTMEQTARHCFETITSPKVPIIFTGAMRPIGFTDSDAIQNVTEALVLAFVVAPGIYISFHNRLFRVPNVTKDRDMGTFIQS